MKNDCPREEWEQEQYFKWVYVKQIKHPELKLVNGSMNGIRVSPKLRQKLKLQGLRKGIPDIDIPIPRHGYTGLRIELKRVKGGSVSKDQKRCHELLRGQGWLVEVCRGWKQAVEATINYLSLDEDCC